MPVMDEFKEERAAMKEKPFKERFSYFWDYHKNHVLISILAVVLVSSLVVQILNRKDTVFFAAMLNCIDLTNSSGEYAAAFEEHVGINSEKEAAIFDTTMSINMSDMDEITKSSLEKMMIYLAAQEIDVVLGDEKIMENYANNETFMDLRTVLSAEQIAKYEPYFYYIDQAVIEEKKAQQDAMNYDYVPVYPDPRQPELMDTPIPVGIYLDNVKSLEGSFYFTGENPLIAIVLNSSRPELSVQYIDYIFQ